MRNRYSNFVADAHVLWWFLTAPERLSDPVSSIFRLAETGNAIIFVPAIVVAEICFLSVKEGKPLPPAALLDQLASLNGIELSDLGRGQLELLDQFPEIRDMHDRLIASDSMYLNAPLLTIDRELIALTQIQTVW